MCVLVTPGKNSRMDLAQIVLFHVKDSASLFYMSYFTSSAKIYFVVVSFIPENTPVEIFIITVQLFQLMSHRERTIDLYQVNREQIM